MGWTYTNSEGDTIIRDGYPIVYAVVSDDDVLATHRLVDDPPHGLSRVARMTCSDCGRAVLRVPGGKPYGSATEAMCDGGEATGC